MADVIVAFQKIQEAKNLSRLLMKNGYEVGAVCDSGAQVMEAVNRLDGGVVICGHHFQDMHFLEIRDALPEGFGLLLIASPGKLDESDLEGIISLAMPIKVQDLLDTLEMMIGQYFRWKKKQKKRRKKRSEDEKKTIQRVKELLMERNHMAEDEAYRYIQKCSMDSGTGMVETALMILDLNGKEWEL